MSEPAVNALLAAPWLDGGAAPAAAAGAPLRLDDAAVWWLVEAGRVELFAVDAPGPEGEPGARTHLATAGAGQLLCGLEGEGAEGAGVLAAPAQGSRLRRLDPADLEHLAADPARRAALAALIDGWLELLTAALAPGPGPRAFDEIGPGADGADGAEVEVAAAGRAVRPRGGTGVVWARQLEGSSALLGLPALGFAAGGLAPVSAAGWLTATAPCRLAGTGSEELLARGELRPALARFHRRVLALLAANRLAADGRERERLERKTAHDRELLLGAYNRLAAVLVPHPAAAAPPGGPAAAPLLAACRLVAGAQGMPFPAVAVADAGRRRGEHLAGLCAAARVRYRRVILRDPWWRRDNGPLVGFRLPPEGKGPPLPVALLPASSESYVLVSPAEGVRQPVDAAVAEGLAGEAFMLYKPLPERPLGAADLLRAALDGRRGDLWLLALMGLASGLLALLVPIVSGQVFGHVIPDADRAGLWQIILVLVVSALAASAFQLTRGFVVLRLSAKFEGTVQAAVWDRLLSLPVDFFRRFTVGDLADRSLGIERIRELLTGNVTTSILTAVFSVFSFALLFYYSARLALAATALTLVLVGLSAALTWLQLRHQRQLLAMQGKIASLLLGLIQGVTKLRVAGAEERAFSRWAERFAGQRERSILARQVANAQAAFSAAYTVLTSLAIFAMAGWSADSGLPVGEFLAFNAAFGQFLVAALSTVGLLSSVLTIVPLYERLAPILETAPEVDAEKVDAGELAGDVEFSHVSFRYDEQGPLVLDDVSFNAAAGEFIALVGASGSGKSTSLRLLLGFERPASGSIYFDGQDLAGLGIQSVRRQIGVVMQHSRVMSGDIFTNIIGGANLTIEDAWEAARMAGLEDDIRAMPMGMHTMVSEGAETFSGGQRQRLLIARAIVNRPRILLFDEATSALDNRTQELVSRSLEGLKATRIVIAHRLSTIVNADRIYVVAAGRVVESGTYRELLERGGAFAELARRQIV